MAFRTLHRWHCLAAVAVWSCATAPRAGPAPRAGTQTAGEDLAITRARCVSCHDRETSDTLSRQHLEASVGCTGCHELRGDHEAKGAAPARTGATLKSTSLGASALEAVEAACRSCHPGPRRGADISKSFLHWRNASRQGLYGGHRGERCVGCHRH